MSQSAFSKIRNVEAAAEPDMIAETVDTPPSVELDLIDQGRRDFQMLVDAVSNYAAYMLCPQGIVSSWNKGAERHKGYRAEEAIGLDVLTF